MPRQSTRASWLVAAVVLVGCGVPAEESTTNRDYLRDLARVLIDVSAVFDRVHSDSLYVGVEAFRLHVSNANAVMEPWLADSTFASRRSAREAQLALEKLSDAGDAFARFIETGSERDWAEVQVKYQDARNDLLGMAAAVHEDRSLRLNQRDKQQLAETLGAMLEQMANLLPVQPPDSADHPAELWAMSLLIGNVLGDDVDVALDQASARIRAARQSSK